VIRTLTIHRDPDSPSTYLPTMASPNVRHLLEELERICRKTTRCHRIPYINLKGFHTLLDPLEDLIPVAVLDDLISSAACWIQVEI
jgi:hypothetical protein